MSTYIRQVLVGVGFQENKLNDSPAGASHPACREIVGVVLGGWGMACLPNNSRVFRCQNEIEYSTCLHLDCGQAELPKRVIGQRHHVSEACETRRETNGHHGHASSSLLFVPPPTLDFQIPFEGKTPCVASSVDLNPDAYKQTTRFILKREKKNIHHGWRTRMFQLRWMCVVFPCRLSSFFCSFRVRRRVPSCTDAAAYTIPPFLPPFFFSFSFFLFAWCGADGDRVFSFIHCIYIDPAQFKKKKTFVQTKMCVALVRWTPGRKLSQSGNTYLVNAPNDC